jgi:hypothetical protein
MSSMTLVINNEKTRDSAEDSMSLTIPGVDRSLPILNRSKFKKREVRDGRFSESKAHCLGVQVTARVDSEIP